MEEISQELQNNINNKKDNIDLGVSSRIRKRLYRLKSPQRVNTTKSLPDDTIMSDDDKSMNLVINQEDSIFVENSIENKTEIEKTEEPSSVLKKLQITTQIGEQVPELTQVPGLTLGQVQTIKETKNDTISSKLNRFWNTNRKWILYVLLAIILALIIGSLVYLFKNKSSTDSEKIETKTDAQSDVKSDLKLVESSEAKSNRMTASIMSSQNLELLGLSP